MASLLFALGLIAVELVYLRGWYRLRNATPRLLSVWRLAAFSCGLLTLWGGCRIALRRHGSSPSHSPYGAAPSSDDSKRSADSGRSACDRPAEWVAEIDRESCFSAVIALSGTNIWTCGHTSAGLLVGRRGNRNRMAHSDSVRIGDAFGSVARSRTGMLLRRRHSVLVARRPAVAQPRRVVRMGPSLVPFSRDLTMRRPVGISYVLRPRGYPHYVSAHRMFDISPLGDQECAGALMWVWVTFAYLAPAVMVTIKTLSPQRRAEGGGV